MHNYNYLPNYHRADWNTIRLYLGAIDWETELRNRDANEMCKKIYDEIYFIIGNFIPKKVIHNQKFAVWDNAEIQSLIRKKKKKWREFKLNPTRRNKNIYNRLSKNVSRKIKEIKREYERNRFRNKNVSTHTQNVTNNHYIQFG